MERLRDFRTHHGPHVGRKGGVQRNVVLGRRDGINGGVEIDDLSIRVYPRVRAACRVHGYREAVHAFESVLDGTLHGAARTLHLPAHEVGTVVCNG